MTTQRHVPTATLSSTPEGDAALDGDEAFDELDDTLRSVLRRPQVDRPTVDALDLAGDIE